MTVQDQSEKIDYAADGDVSFTPSFGGYTVREQIVKMAAARIKEGKSTVEVAMMPTYLENLLSELDAISYRRPFHVQRSDDTWVIELGVLGRIVRCVADEKIADDHFRWSL